jgi:hypothetical protein
MSDDSFLRCSDVLGSCVLSKTENVQSADALNGEMMYVSLLQQQEHQPCNLHEYVSAFEWTSWVVGARNQTVGH